MSQSHGECEIKKTGYKRAGKPSPVTRSNMNSLLDPRSVYKYPDREDTRAHYIARLPARPYCTDDLGRLQVLLKHLALKKRYIQHNNPLSVSTLVIDFDNTESHYLWDDLRTPPPNLVVMNPDNGHSHLVYMIKGKIYKHNSRSAGAMRLFSAIEQALVKKLGADMAYNGLISKNPYSDFWTRYNFQDYVYELSDFLEYLDIDIRAKKQPTLFSSGLGRNCSLFETMRHEGYRLYRQQGFGQDSSALFNALYEMSEKVNRSAFAEPLPLIEVRSISKSITRWCMKNLSAKEFAQTQRARALKLGAIRREAAIKGYQEIVDFKKEHPELSIRKLAAVLSTTPRIIQIALEWHNRTLREQDDALQHVLFNDHDNNGVAAVLED